MVYFQKILEAALGLCLVLDSRILKVVDQIGSLLGLRRFSLNKSSVKGLLFKRWVVYSFLAALTIGIGVISCADTRPDLPKIVAPPTEEEPTPKKPGKVIGFEIEPLDAQVKAIWNDPVFEEGAEVSEYKLSVYQVEEFKISHLKTEIQKYIKGTEGPREAVVGDLVNGQIYAFQIQASNDEGDSFPSEKIYSMPRPNGLGSLEGLSSSAGDSVVTLTWNKVELANQYSVLRSLGEDGDDYKELHRGDIMCSTDSTCSFIDVEGLQNAKLYFYKVVAQMVIDDPRLQKHEIVESSAVTPTSNTPRTVTNTQVKVRLGGIDNTRSITDGASVTLSIEEPELVLNEVEITAYKIETLPFTAADDSTNVEATQDIPKAGKITQASVGQPYAQDKKYRVKALSGSAGSYAEIPDTAAFLDVSKISPTKPVLIDFQAGEVTHQNIDLSWRSNTATHYTLKRGANDIFTQRPVSQLTSAEGRLTYTNTHGLGYSANYFFTLVPHIVLPGIEAIDGASISINGVTPPDPNVIEEPDEGELEDLTKFVDVFIGTQYTHSESYQPSRVYPVAAVPFGMVVFTPANSFHAGQSWEEPDNSAGSRTRGRQLPTYKARWSGDRQRIKGFSAYSFQGPGCNISHDFLMMPSTVDADGDNEWLSNNASGSPGKDDSDFKVHTPRVHRTGEAARNTAAANLDEEWAEPGYYRVKTSRNTVIEISATKRTGVMKITYPGNATAGYFHLAAYTRVDGFDDGDSFARVRTGDTTALEGQVRAGQFCGEGGSFRYVMFMYGKFDRAYSESVHRNKTVKRVKEDENEVRVKFDLTTGGQVVVYKFGISYVDMENAKMNLLGRTARPAVPARGDQEALPALTGGVGENVNLTFDQVRANAKTAWNKVLNKIKVRDKHDGTGTKYATRTGDKRRFYTFLFRSLLHPNIFDDVDGRYVGFDGSSTKGSAQKAYHTLPSTQKHQYQYFSNWDIYRTQIPLLALIDKQVSRDIARSLLNNANQASDRDNEGGFTRWGVANHDSGVMGGCPSSIMISTGYALGADLSKSEQDKMIQVFERSGKLDDVALEVSYTGSCDDDGSTCRLKEENYNAGAVTSNTRSGGAATIRSTQIRNNPFSKILELAVADYTRSTFIRRSIQQYGTDGRAVSDLADKASAYKSSSRGWTQLFRSGNNVFKKGTTKRYRMHTSGTCNWFGSNHKCYHEGTKQQYEWAIPHDMAGRFEEGGGENCVFTSDSESCVTGGCKTQSAACVTTRKCSDEAACGAKCATDNTLSRQHQKTKAKHREWQEKQDVQPAVEACKTEQKVFG